MSPILQSLANGSARGYGAFFGAGAAGAFESIATLTADGTTSSLTFSNIPQTYQHLQIRCFVTDGGTNTLQMRLNGVTTASYIAHSLEADGSAITAASTSGATVILIAGRTYGLSASSSIFAGAIIDIHDYTSSTKNKTVRAFSGFDANGAAGAPGLVGVNSGLFIDTTAITSVTMRMGSNFTSGSTFALYGIKGA